VTVHYASRNRTPNALSAFGRNDFSSSFLQVVDASPFCQWISDCEEGRLSAWMRHQRLDDPAKKNMFI
jgi:hypothetical protein